MFPTPSYLFFLCDLLGDIITDIYSNYLND